MKQFAWHWHNLAAKESGLECACMNNDDFIVPVTGGGRHHWVSMCAVWPSHSKWLSKKSNGSVSNFPLSLNIPPQDGTEGFWIRCYMSAAQMKVWHKCFKDGQESVESDPHSGRPATSRTSENVERVQSAINKDQQLTVQALEANRGIPKTTVSEVLTQDLGIKCVMAKFVPWLLLPEQNKHCVAVANDLIHTSTNQLDSLNIITRD